MKRQLFTFFLFLLGFASVFAQNPAEWQFKIDKKDSLKVGDTLTFTVGWQGKNGYSWNFRMDSTTASVLEPLPGDTTLSQVGNETQYQIKLPFIFWGFQKDTLNPLLFVLKNEVSKDSVWFQTPDLFLNPKLITAEGDTLPRPEKDIYETSRPWWQYALWVLGGLLLAGLIYYLYRRYMIKRNMKLDVVETVPIVEKTPWELFQLAMDDLLARQVLWPEDVKTYYSDLIEILKTYLERTTSSTVLEMTSDELLSWLNEKPALKSALPDMNELLNRADLIKFAKQNTVQSQMNDDFNKVRISVHKLETSPNPRNTEILTPELPKAEPEPGEKS